MKGSRIALGAYLLSGTPGYRQAGIHQYTCALLEALAHSDTGDMRLEVFASPTARQEIEKSTFASAFEMHYTRRSTETPFSRIRVEQLDTPQHLRDLGVDLYHGLAFVAPLRAPCPTVVTVHDLSFITRPQTHKLFNRTYLRLFTRLSCRRAVRIIAVSEWTRRDIVRLLGVDTETVDVIPHGVHQRYHPLPVSQVDDFRARNHLGTHTIFFLGSLEPRKNLPTLIEAFHAIIARVPDAELVIGGSPGWKYKRIFARIQELGLKDRVRFIGQVEQETLPGWYNACAVFAYPSLYEGFGLPPLEAMACGAPVVTSNVTSLPEVIGDAGIMVAPTDTPALANALLCVLTDEPLRRKLSELSIWRAGTFTWSRTATLTLETYRHALG